MRAATTPRPVCVHCGAKYGQRITTYEQVRWPEGEPMPAHEGDGIVTNTATPYRTTPNATTPMLVTGRDIWDGVSWSAPYEPFCTLRCALSYARKAYARGYIEDEAQKKLTRS
jgi:hypothetical protein